MLRGCIDRAEGLVSGWAYDDEQPLTAVELTIFINGQPSHVVLANAERNDLAVLGTGTTKYGFTTEPIPSLSIEDNVFAAYNCQYIVPSARAKDFHLTNMLHHSWLLSSRFSVVDIEHSGLSESRDTRLARRMIEALNFGLCRTTVSYGVLWDQIIDTHHREVVCLARNNDELGLLRYLAGLGSQPLAIGFFDGPEANEGARNNPAFRAAASRVIFDRLLSLSEALGCSLVENPEQGPWAQSSKFSVDEIFGRICAKLGLEGALPPIGGYWGIPSKFGVLNARILDAIYLAFRADSLRKRFGLHGVTEIGGGAGLAAHAAIALGCLPYRIVDLPTVLMVQAYTLRYHDRLLLDGERFDQRDVVLTSDFENHTPQKFDLLINCDSLPEIATSSALAYLEKARVSGYKVFLSINQESGTAVDDWQQNKVQDLTSHVGGYSLVSRHRHWMRPGYVEEIYTIDD